MVGPSKTLRVLAAHMAGPSLRTVAESVSVSPGSAEAGIALRLEASAARRDAGLGFAAANDGRLCCCPVQRGRDDAGVQSRQKRRATATADHCARKHDALCADGERPPRKVARFAHVMRTSLPTFGRARGSQHRSSSLQWSRTQLVSSSGELLRDHANAPCPARKRLRRPKRVASRAVQPSDSAADLRTAAVNPSALGRTLPSTTSAGSWARLRRRTTVPYEIVPKSDKRTDAGSRSILRRRRSARIRSGTCRRTRIRSTQAAGDCGCFAGTEVDQSADPNLATPVEGADAAPRCRVWSGWPSFGARRPLTYQVDGSRGV